MILLDVEIPRTLDMLVREFSAPGWQGGRLEAWLFEDEAARRGAERALARAGVSARLRSAYKPLLHAVLEELPPGPLTVALPTREAARFRLEAYPLAGLRQCAFVDGGAELSYRVTVAGQAADVFAPNLVHDGQTALSPCGWVRAWRAGEVRPARDEPVETEYEAAFAAVMRAVAGHGWGVRTPYFDVLGIEVAIGGIERAVDWHDEVLSTREALHEDMYFSLLEFFQAHAGLRAGDRTLQPGQIVPRVVAGAGAARVRVALVAGEVGPEPAGDAGDLELMERPLTAGEIATALAGLGGAGFTHRSVRGRVILGSHLVSREARSFTPHPDPLPQGEREKGIAITAGQHANETSGVVGALRAARRLVESDVEFALVPQDNPDGYALHHALRRDNPRHMHHAARYTALGDDLESRLAPPYFEKAARMEAIARANAVLHLNLHGYPAHEWTRPLSGYLPRGFELWSIPKGFFLILRHWPGKGAAAEPFLRAMCARLAEDPALAAFNASQLAVWRAHAGELSFPVFDGIPCMIAERDGQGSPYQLITEYPDETIYGEAFRLAHTTQMRTVLIAAELVRAGMLSP